VIIFSSLNDLQQYLEPADVRAGVYTAAFDALGRRLTLGLAREALSWWARPFAQDRAMLRLDDTPGDSEVLRRVLLPSREWDEPRGSLTWTCQRSLSWRQSCALDGDVA